jgi:uncharacterized repeat protein (TIGR03803 family)
MFGLRCRLPKVLAIAIVLAAPVRGASAQFQFEIVHSFSSTGSGGRTPSAPLFEAADGSIYGTTPNGGAGDAGVVFQLWPDRSFVARDLQGNTTGKNSYGGLVQLADGTLYGTTISGGASSSGTFFAITPSGTFVTYDLPKVQTPGFGLFPAPGPSAGPVLAADGNLYVAVPGSRFVSNSFHLGGIARMTPQGVLTKTFAAHGDQLNAPNSQLVAGPGGDLYGTATGFNSGLGWSAFRFRPSTGQWDVLHTFATDEGLPTALVLAPDGNLYGAATRASVTAALFRMTPSGSLTVLHQFQTATEGAQPTAPPVVGGDGYLYGAMSRGGALDAGTIFRISPAGAFEVIHTFTGGDDGGQPLGALMQATDGSFYGTASIGGPDGGGVVFRIKSLATEPIMTIDIPGAGATVGRTFTIAGWTIDRKAFAGTGIDAVHVYAFPNPGSGAAPIFLGVAAQGMTRPDVGALFGSQFTASGYGVVSPSLAPGPYLIAALGRSTVTSTFSAVATRVVTVVAPQSLPYMSMDVPASNATVTGQIFVGGWALDFAAPAGTGVDTIHVWAVPADGSPAIFVGVATPGIVRPDVGAAFGSRFTASGYQVTATLPPGRYTIAAFAWSTVAGAFNNVRMATNVTVQ